MSMLKNGEWNGENLALAQILPLIGVCVPDQEKARHMKEVMRIGLHPSVSKTRLAIAWFRKLWARGVRYHVFMYDEFNETTTISWNYGGEMPEEIRQQAEHVRSCIPAVQLEVHATYDDPWLVARYGGDVLILRGWYRRGRGSPIEIIL